MCGEPWSGAAGRRFAALVRGCALLAEVFSVVHGVLHVDAYRPAGAQGSIDVRAALVREGYAELAEEPYESKVRVRGAWGPVASQDPQPALGAGAGAGGGAGLRPVGPLGASSRFSSRRSVAGRVPLLRLAS